MPIQLIHVSDIHFGSGESHGQINPETGLNVRFEDFVAALAKVVDYALDKRIDVFLFSGDAYKNATPEPVYQKMFARELKRLSNGGIKTILLVGNHDQLLRSTSSHAMSVFQSLEVPGMITIDQPKLCRLETKNGAMQLIGLPHVTRHQLMTKESYNSLSSAAIDRKLVEHVTNLLRGYYDQLDPSVPTVVTAHMSLDKALAGIEQELLIGYTLTFPTEIFIDPKVDYAALGHVHKHQVIRDRAPAIVYAGSLERVDFGEEAEDKGFVHVSLERENTSYQFHSIQPRPFVTVDLDLHDTDDPTEKLLRSIEKNTIPGCVLRVRYKIKEDQVHKIDEEPLRKAASIALTYRIQPDIVPSHNRSRLPQLTESLATSPLVALESYLAEIAPERKEQLLKKARTLINDVQSNSIPNSSDVDKN